MRINKYIADAGYASRRAADKLIVEGKVKINGRTVSQPGTDVNEQNDTVTVDGVQLSLSARPVYIMLNKPKGCVCTMKDDKDRKTVMDYVDIADNKRVFPIGRLDYDTEGLLLLTNDGALTYKFTHPSHEIPKTYIAKTEGEAAESDLAALRNGVELDGVKTHTAKIKLLAKEAGNICRYEVTIFEGKNRQVHRMFESIGKEVVFLKRTSVGSIRLGGLARGKYRYLTDREIEECKRI
jgi:pseudouridine synthase